MALTFLKFILWLPLVVHISATITRMLLFICALSLQNMAIELIFLVNALGLSEHSNFICALKFISRKWQIYCLSACLHKFSDGLKALFFCLLKLKRPSEC